MIDELINVLGRVADEIEEQQYGRHSNDHIGRPEWSQSDRLAILTAEVGEVAEELTLNLHPPKRSDLIPERLQRIRDELIQVAACAAHWAAVLDLEATRLQEQE